MPKRKRKDMEDKLGFLIEDKVFEDDQQRLIDTLIKKNIRRSLYQDFEFSDLILKCDKIFCYGSLEWVMNTNNKKWNSSKIKRFCTIENYDCRIYYPYFKEYLFNKNFIIRKFNEIHKYLEIGQPLFVRPVVGYKPGDLLVGFIEGKI
jgi:hypothetical protein